MKRPALLRRLPPLFGPVKASPIVSREDRRDFADLEEDFELLDTHLVPEFERLDREALRAQATFRRQQLILIIGGVVTTILGGLHVALGSSWRGAAVAEGVVALLLSFVVFVAQRRPAQQRY